MPQGAIEKWHEPHDESEPHDKSELLHDEPEPHDESEEAIQILVHDGAPATTQGPVRIPLPRARGRRTLRPRALNKRVRVRSRNGQYFS